MNKENIKFHRRAVLMVVGLISVVHVRAAETELSVPMDYRLIRSVLLQQLYTGEGQTARLWKDGKGCSFLDIANPRLAGEQGLVKLENDVHARIGIVLANQCMPAVEWKGMLQTFQQPVLDADGNVLRFPVVKLNAYDQNNHALNVKQLLDLINRAVQPKLAELKIDLNRSKRDIVDTLLPFVDAEATEALQDMVNSLRFSRVQAGDKALMVTIGFTESDLETPDNHSIAALSAEELQRWKTIWEDWTETLSALLSRPPLNRQAEANKAQFLEIMKDAGSTFEQALSGQDDGEQDSVRMFFDDSWDKLAPLLRTASQEMPGTEGLRYLTLISATDLLRKLESFAQPLGLDISANGLRKLVRAYLAHQASQPKNG